MGRRATWIALAALLAGTAVAYWPSVDGDFVLDDHQLLQEPLVAAPLAAGPSAWLAAPRPALTATFALNMAAVGLDPRGWHLTNLAIHLLAALLAWRLARRLLARAGLGGPEGPALAAAGLFALHPLQTGSVAYVTQRGESLASALTLGALLLLLRRDEAPAGRRATLLGGAAALLALGLLVKPVAATLPLAWLLAATLLPPAAEAAARPLARVRARLPAAAPLLALGLASALWNVSAATGSNHAGFGLPEVPAATYLATQLHVIPTYLARLAWPAGQCADCEIPWSGGLLDPAALGGGAFLAAALGGALWLAHRARTATGDGAAVARLAPFGLAFFLLLLAPTSSLLPLRDPLAEHRVYLASLGLFVAVAAAAAAAARRLAGPSPARATAAGLAAAALLLAALGVATARRNATWASALAFHQAAAASAPGKARVHLNLGAALMAARRFEEALASFRRAQALEADRTVSPRLVFENLTGALLATGRAEEARAAVQDVLRTEGEEPWALGLLAEVAHVTGQPAEAEAAARRALAREATSPRALKYLGLSLVQRGDFAGAAGPLRAAAEAGTADPTVFYWLGATEAELGDRAEACRALAHGASLPSSAAQLERALGLLARLGCR